MSSSNNPNDQLFESIRVVGGLLTSQVLREVRNYALPGQTPADYGIPKGLKLADELRRYWRIAQGHWKAYNEQCQRTDIHPERLAIKLWLLPLLNDVLGFRIEPAQPKRIGMREFPITHFANDGTVPLVLCDAGKELDQGDVAFGQDGNKRSPVGLAQEYLNAENACLWTLVSNGVQLRVLRDNPAMTRPAYIEVDLARLFDEANYAEFATLWLLLHRSRTEPQNGMLENCWLEQWRQKGATEGERALGELRYGVADALRALGTGFVAHPHNQALREQIGGGELSTDHYYQQVLRLVYRLLFLLTAEDRDLALLPVDHDGQDYTAARSLYQQSYSVAQLRKRSRLRAHHDQYGDAWQQLLITLSGFANGQPSLAQPALGGLFAPDQCAALEACELENRYLYEALFKLGYFQHQGVLSPVNYRDMDTEEFGSVYESLLELIPQLRTEGQWRLSFLGDAEDERTANGHARKLSGSYYTPDSLVRELIQSALVPVIEDRLQRNPQNPREAILSITVCDPACGSGHFLLAAARRLATELVRIDAGLDQPTEQHYRPALREVVRNCIYGVDINPLAIELCKTGLWLESIEPGKPLSFLDAHVRCGNALVGVLDPALLENGIPDDAYKALSGDDKKICSELRKTNKFSGEDIALSLNMASIPFIDLETMPDDNMQQIEAIRRAFEQSRQDRQSKDERLMEDLFTAAFFAPKTAETRDRVPTNAHLKLLADGGTLPEGVYRMVTELAETHQFFHWPLAFPQVFGEKGTGGFDVMLGNPPWERIKLQEKEFFAARSTNIARAANTAARNRLINALTTSDIPADRALYDNFMRAKQGAEGSSAFARLSGRYPLTGRGDVNLYAIFAEHFAKAINPEGRAGAIVPTGIATDDSTKFFFGWLAEGNRLASLYDFENRDALFPGVHRSYKFCLLTMGQNLPQATLAFFATQTPQLKDDRRRFSLSSEEFALINPNTKTCPVFRSQMDAELTKKLYRAAPILIREATDKAPEQNDWGIRFQAMVHMSADSGLFKTHGELEELSVTGYQLSDGGNRTTDNRQLITDNHLRLYEAKMIHHYDHRWATYETDGETSRDCTLAEKQDPNYVNQPRYWVAENEVTLRTARAPKAVLDAAKKQDTEALTTALKLWAVGALLALRPEKKHGSVIESLLNAPKQGTSGDVFATGPSPQTEAARQMQHDYPLSDEECTQLMNSLKAEADPWALVWPLLELRRPKYLLGWRNICRATDERTVIAGVAPLSAVGHSMPLINLGASPRLTAAFLGCLTSIPYDFVARQKIGGTNLTFGYIKQFPTFAPDQYTKTDLEFMVPRVLELTYTAHNLKPFAEDLDYFGEPFLFDPERRHQLKSELDAYYAKLYGLTRDELRYILDPADVMGEDYPSETFRVLKNKEIKEFGEYRTRKLVLEAFDALSEIERGDQRVVVGI